MPSASGDADGVVIVRGSDDCGPYHWLGFIVLIITVFWLVIT